MKKLSKDEMKKVMGGVDATVDTIYYNNGTSKPHPQGDCTCGSVGLCDEDGGIKNFAFVGFLFFSQCRSS